MTEERRIEKTMNKEEIIKRIEKAGEKASLVTNKDNFLLTDIIFQLAGELKEIKIKLSEK